MLFLAANYVSLASSDFSILSANINLKQWSGACPGSLSKWLENGGTSCRKLLVSEMLDASYFGVDKCLHALRASVGLFPGVKETGDTVVLSGDN